MEPKYEFNAFVIYVDTHGESHSALVTQWWPNMGGMSGEPGCNLVYVSKDVNKRDPYGQQLERATSVCHMEKQSAPGNYWKWPTELSK